MMATSMAKELPASKKSVKAIEMVSNNQIARTLFVSEQALFP